MVEKVQEVALNNDIDHKKLISKQINQLTSHTEKVLAKILTRRHKNKIVQKISKKQFGFRTGKVTRDEIGILRIMSDRCLDVQEPSTESTGIRLRRL